MLRFWQKFDKSFNYVLQYNTYSQNEYVVRRQEKLQPFIIAGKNNEIKWNEERYIYEYLLRFVSYQLLCYEWRANICDGGYFFLAYMRKIIQERVQCFSDCARLRVIFPIK